MPDISGSQALATKAAGRRTRVAVFGGSLNKKVGRRGRAGAQFNKGGGTPFQRAQQRIRAAAKAKSVSVPQVEDEFDDDDDGGDDF